MTSSSLNLPENLCLNHVGNVKPRYMRKIAIRIIIRDMVNRIAEGGKIVSNRVKRQTI